MPVQIKIINRSKHPLPQYATVLSAGLDLKADLNEPIVLKPLQRQLISTGLFIELPAGYEAQIRPRSGLAFKSGVTVLNSPGTIDADYRGEVKVLLVNLGEAPFVIERGMRVAQLLVAPVLRVEPVEVVTVNQTTRAAGGFGSTGLN